MLLVDSLGMTDTVVVGFTQPVNIRMPIMVDILVVPLISFIKLIATSSSHHGGHYFDS